MVRTYKQRKKEPYRVAIYTKLTEAQDRRRKILISEYDNIRKRYIKDKESLRRIARSYGVDKRLIQFILYPKRLDRQKARKKAQRYSQNYYYSVTRGKKWRETMREHRHYKKGLILSSNGDK